MSMTQEDKQLIFQDICARLPYGVEVQYKGNNYDLNELHKDGRTYLGSYNSIYGSWLCGFNFEYYPKPYLRSLSSLTDEEEEEYEKVIRGSFEKQLEFYLRNHLDFRGLIPKGLAIEAPEGMYNK